jgi:hypothetical protein
MAIDFDQEEEQKVQAVEPKGESDLFPLINFAWLFNLAGLLEAVSHANCAYHAGAASDLNCDDPKAEEEVTKLLGGNSEADEPEQGEEGEI